MDVSAIPAALENLVLERLPDGRFVKAGVCPTWCLALQSQLLREERPFDVEELFPFLAAFLPQAESAWRDEPKVGSVDSDFWTEIGSSGEELHLEASAVSVGASQVLVIARNERLFLQQQLMLQRAR